MDYELVSYAPDHDAAIALLQTNLWTRDPGLNLAFLKWKYQENPFLDETLIQLAMQGDRAIAMRGLFGALWEVDDSPERHLIPYADDFVVAPECRNRGLASRIMSESLEDAARRGFPFAVSLSAGPVTFVSSLAAGWRSAGVYEFAWYRRTARARLDRMLGMLRRTRAYQVAIRRASRPPNLFRRLDDRGRQGAGHVSLSGEPRPAEMAELVARLPWDGRIRHVRDTAYFAWRFRNPIHEYRFLYWDEDGLQGYLVLQRYLSDRSDGSYVNISDWEGTSDRVRAGLLDAALGWGRFTRTRALLNGAPEPARSLLRDRGFTPDPAGSVRQYRGLLVRGLGAAPRDAPWRLGGRNMLDIEDWDLRMLYSMIG